MDEKKSELNRIVSDVMSGAMKFADTFTDTMGLPAGFLGDMKSTSDFFAQMLTKMLSSAKDVVEERKKSVTENETDMLADEATHWGYQHILNDYYKEDLYLMGSYCYQKISDEVYQYIRDLIINEYDFSDDGWDIMYDALADLVYERVDFSYIWQAIDEVTNAPMTMEEKLAEVGMSVKDFL